MEPRRYLPGLQTHRVVFPEDREQARVQPPAPGLERPLWLLREPRALDQQEGRPCHRGPLRLRAGPERIEAGWWEARPVQRDYYVAEDDDAVLYWVFRTRLAEHVPAVWYLHGRFG